MVSLICVTAERSLYWTPEHELLNWSSNIAVIIII